MVLSPDPGGFNIVIHASNATLAQPISKGRLVNNLVLALGGIEFDGTFIGGMNIKSVTPVNGGMYDVGFNTPMPSAIYSVIGSVAELGTQHQLHSFSSLARHLMDSVSTCLGTTDLLFLQL